MAGSQGRMSLQDETVGAALVSHRAPVVQPELDTIGTRSWVVLDRQCLSSMLQDVAESSSGGGVLLWGLGFPVTFVCLSQPSLPLNFRHHLAQAVH